MKNRLILSAILIIGMTWSSPSRGDTPQFTGSFQLQNIEFQGVHTLSPGILNGITVINFCDLNTSTIQLFAKTTSLSASNDSVDLTVDCGDNDKFSLRIHRDALKDLLAHEGDKITLNQVTANKISSTMAGPDDDAISVVTFDTVNVEVKKMGDTDMAFVMTYSPKITSSNEDLTVLIDGVAASKALVDAKAQSGTASNQAAPAPAPAAEPVTTNKAEGGCSLGGMGGSTEFYLFQLAAWYGGATLLTAIQGKKRRRDR